MDVHRFQATATAGAPTRTAVRPTVEWVEDEAGFLALERDWDELEAAQPSPFLTHAWLRSWWESFGAGTPRICTVRRGPELAAALPLWARGKRMAGWSNFETDVFRPLARTEDDLRLLVDAVVAAGFSRLTVRALPVEEPGAAMLVSRLRHRHLTISEHVEDSPIIETAGSLEDYRGTMSRNTRQRVGKLRRRMDREHQLELRCIESPADPAGHLAKALAIEANGWKGRARSAVLSSPERSAFYAAIADRFAATGSFRISELRLDGRLAAFDLALLHRGRLYSLITSYDQDFGRYSPGLVLRMAIVEACFAHGLEANELLGTLMDWKTKFVTGTRDMHTLRAYRRTPVPALRYGARTTLIPFARSAADTLKEARRRRARSR